MASAAGGIIPARAGFTRCRPPFARNIADHPRSRGVYRGTSRRASTWTRIIPARAGFTGHEDLHTHSVGDHPRSRGVYGLAGKNRDSRSGSSPLARGLLGRVVQRVRVHGIIPARAGFTISSKRPPLTHRDHPRSRGVYRSEEWSASTPAGSSPLARGLRRADVLLAAGVRIIPARAGFTWAPRSGRRPGADHPRSRGVYHPPSLPSPPPPGSSPLARGLRDHDLHGQLDAGIIPARAGFTERPDEVDRGDEDHPRSRGVYIRRFCFASDARGSSPLARGLQGEGIERWRDARIIPARAGFTHHREYRRSHSQDHPRSRGVYSSAAAKRSAISGSSPLARGLRPGRPERINHVGIIPARAGFTPPWKVCRMVVRDHPRSRGVYRLERIEQDVTEGSSPLARGLRGERGDGGRQGRIIPARAGFTHRGGVHRRAPGPDHPRSRGVYCDALPGRVLAPGSSPLARGLLPS